MLQLWKLLLMHHLFLSRPKPLLFFPNFSICTTSTHYLHILRPKNSHDFFIFATIFFMKETVKRGYFKLLKLLQQLSIINVLIKASTTQTSLGLIDWCIKLQVINSAFKWVGKSLIKDTNTTIAENEFFSNIAILFSKIGYVRILLQSIILVFCKKHIEWNVKSSWQGLIDFIYSDNNIGLKTDEMNYLQGALLITSPL